MILGRRELLKISPVAWMLGSGEVSKALPLEAGHHYLMFYDARAIDIDRLLDGACDFPEGTVINVVRVHLHQDQTIDEAVRIYDLDNPRT